MSLVQAATTVELYTYPSKHWHEVCEVSERVVGHEAHDVVDEDVQVRQVTEQA